MDKNEANRSCQHCGKPLDAKAIQGLCPACLLKAGWPTATEGGLDSGFTPPEIDQLSELFPQLEILELVGQGGMGAVYKARQPELDRLVALKVLAPRDKADPGFAERFTREARALARLNHPNIVAVYDFGQRDELHYFIMEYVDGPNLRQVEKAGELEARTALEIIPQICEALQFAHDEGVVHRDIKPENVLLDQKGRIKIADFGLAKIMGKAHENLTLTQAGHVMGTPHYMAPEQVEHPQEVDHRADIYSLGVVFYEMLTGELPLGRFAPPSKKVEVDVRLDEVVLRTLEKEPEQRYQKASQVGTEVRTIVRTPDVQSAGDVLKTKLKEQMRLMQGVEYRSERKLWGLPLVHVATGMDLDTGQRRVARGIIAIGDAAQGVIAFGGLAMGGLAFGGLSLGVFSLGGLAIGLVALGGWAIGLGLAIGGGAIGFVAMGGGAAGYYAYGGGAVGVHALGSNVQDPVAKALFEPFGRVVLERIVTVFVISLIPVLGIGAGTPLYIQHKQAKRQGLDRQSLERRQVLIGVVIVVSIMAGVMIPPAWIQMIRGRSRSTPPEPVTLEAPAGFTPICELTLHAGPELRNCFADLDTGRVMSAPRALAKSLGGRGHPQINHELARWMQENGVDLFRRTNDLTMIDGFSIQVGEGRERPFETITAEDMARDGVYFSKFLDKELPADPNSPVRTQFALRQEGGVYELLTRSGRPGLIQILEDNAETGEIRIRFKLVSKDVTTK